MLELNLTPTFALQLVDFNRFWCSEFKVTMLQIVHPSNHLSLFIFHAGVNPNYLQAKAGYNLEIFKATFKTSWSNMIVLCAYHSWSCVILLKSLLAGRTQVDSLNLLRVGTVLNTVNPQRLPWQYWIKDEGSGCRAECSCVWKATYKGFQPEECE